MEHCKIAYAARRIEIERAASRLVEFDNDSERLRLRSEPSRRVAPRREGLRSIFLENAVSAYSAVFEEIRET